MPKRLSLTFTENDTVAIAELLEREAPVTTEAVWNALETPATNRVIHAMYSGREIVFDMPPPHGEAHERLKTLPRENQILIPLPGDVCFHYFAPYELHQGACNPSHESGLFDFMVFYGRNARIFSSQGWVPVNLFARIVENLDGFAAMCERVHREGMKEVRIERIGDGG